MRDEYQSPAGYGCPVQFVKTCFCFVFAGEGDNAPYRDGAAEAQRRLEETRAAGRAEIGNALARQALQGPAVFGVEMLGKF